MAERVGILQQGPPLDLLTNEMVVVATHDPCQLGATDHKDTSSTWPALKRVPHRVPKPVRHSFHCVLLLVSPCHKVPNLVRRSFHVTKYRLSPAVFPAHSKFAHT